MKRAAAAAAARARAAAAAAAWARAAAAAVAAQERAAMVSAAGESQRCGAGNAKAFARGVQLSSLSGWEARTPHVVVGPQQTTSNAVTKALVRRTLVLLRGASWMGE